MFVFYSIHYRKFQLYNIYTYIKYRMTARDEDSELVGEEPTSNSIL